MFVLTIKVDSDIIAFVYFESIRAWSEIRVSAAPYHGKSEAKRS